MSDAVGYFLTFRTYGTWLHGDPRGSVDRENNGFGAIRLLRDDGLRNRRRAGTRDQTMVLDAARRDVVHRSIQSTCRFRKWELWALNVRTNHVHCVVGSGKSPESMMADLKAWATRALREAGMVEQTRIVWASHGSTRYLWDEAAVAAAVEYTLFEQG